MVVQTMLAFPDLVVLRSSQILNPHFPGASRFVDEEHRPGTTHNLGLRARGLGFAAWDLGFRVWDLSFWDWGLGFQGLLKAALLCTTRRVTSEVTTRRTTLLKS